MDIYQHYNCSQKLSHNLISFKILAKRKLEFKLPIRFQALKGSGSLIQNFWTLGYFY